MWEELAQPSQESSHEHPNSKTNMPSTFQSLVSRVFISRTSLCLLFALLGTSGLHAQMSAAEHASHHPGTATTPSAGMGPPAGVGPSGGMGGMMDGMMEKMGAPKPRDLYPTLMGLPALTPENRTEVEVQAKERINAGVALMGTGMDSFSMAASTDDYATMQKAVATVQEGLAQMDSGVAARRALAEGLAPRVVALDWFKREMNLLPPVATLPQHGFGGSAFHLTTIAILAAFAALMIWMYFFKMRRAAALLKELASPGAMAPASAPSAAASATAVATTAPAAAPAKPPEFPAMRSLTEPVSKWSGRLRVCRIFDETPGVKTFRLAAQDDLALPFTYFPGQFVTLAFDLGGKRVKRSYTIASTPTQLHYCGITVKREEQGLVSRHLHDQIKEGDLVDVSGPNGKFTFTGTEAASIVLVAGGVGITPMMSVIRYLTDIGWHGDIFLLYCCRTTSDFIFREELEQLQQRNSNLSVFATMTRSAGTVWMGLKGRFSAEIIDHLVPDITTRRIHVCGPPAMMDAVVQMMKDLKVPDEQVKTEAFGPASKPVEKSGRPVSPETTATDSVSTTIQFTKSGKSASLAPNQTVLEAAESAGVEIDNSCLSGQCGLCKVRLCSGKVNMECDDALSDDDKAAGLILACQAKATENLEVEA